MPIEPMILAAILLASRAFGVPAPLISAIIDVESNWNILATGGFDEKGVPHAFGLGQLHDQGAGYGYTQDALYDPYLNIFVTTDYIRFCQTLFPNNLKLAIACYLQGPEGTAVKGYGGVSVYVTNVLNQMEKYEEELKPSRKEGK